MKKKVESLSGMYCVFQVKKWLMGEPLRLIKENLGCFETLNVSLCAIIPVERTDFNSFIWSVGPGSRRFLSSTVNILTVIALINGKRFILLKSRYPWGINVWSCLAVLFWMRIEMYGLLLIQSYDFFLYNNNKKYTSNVLFKEKEWKKNIFPVSPWGPMMLNIFF